MQIFYIQQLIYCLEATHKMLLVGGVRRIFFFAYSLLLSVNKYTRVVNNFLHENEEKNKK